MTFSFPISSGDLLARGGSHVQIGSGPCISFCANEAVSWRAFFLMTPMATWFVSLLPYILCILPLVAPQNINECVDKSGNWVKWDLSDCLDV